jgi:hypothetical protein
MNPPFYFPDFDEMLESFTSGPIGRELNLRRFKWLEPIGLTRVPALWWRMRGSE